MSPTLRSAPGPPHQPGVSSRRPFVYLPAYPAADDGRPGGTLDRSAWPGYGHSAVAGVTPVLTDKCRARFAGLAAP